MGTQMKAALGIVTVLLLFTICKSWIFDSDALLKKVDRFLTLLARVPAPSLNVMT